MLHVGLASNGTYLLRRDSQPVTTLLPLYNAAFFLIRFSILAFFNFQVHPHIYSIASQSEDRLIRDRSHIITESLFNKVS
ncbi:hypothetical protein BDZ94DRAFT_1276235 [Collybia nuda]|uniref:Uncharacterized protein n=1 Tax=Collybia nuda TaxID=64659 RepID=A0A9P5XST9_9AGAR|nr:hypothetical protein BDZ94DRAFT_1276235 [Collybia nuda]